MKKYFLALFAALCLVPALGQARSHRNPTTDGSFVDSPEDVDQDVFANVGGFVYGVPAVGYEHILGEKTSWTISGQGRYWGEPGYSYNELGLAASVRWWVGKYLPGHRSRPLHGIFVGPQILVNNYAFNYNDGAGIKQNTSSTGFGGGAEAGYQYIFRPGLLVNAGVSAGYVGSNRSFAAGAPDIIYAGGYVNTILTVGWAF